MPNRGDVVNLLGIYTDAVKRVTCTLRDDIHKRLKVFAAHEGKTIIQCIAEAVEMYLHNETKKADNL